MRLAGASDLHGHLTHSMPECDLMVFCGDLVPLWSSAEHWQSRRELEWISTKFTRWLKRQILRSGCEKCIVGPGNHDMLLWDPDTVHFALEALNSIDKVEAFAPKQGVGLTEFKGHYITYYPWTPTIQNRNWAYSLPRSSDAIRYAAESIPHQTDILLSHGPPFGMIDSGYGWGNFGDAALMHRLLEVGPSLTLCGHIHEARGTRMRYWDLLGHERRIGNVSLCDREYSVKGAKVQVFDL